MNSLRILKLSIFSLIFAYIGVLVQAKIIGKYINCTVFEPNIASFELCELKPNEIHLPALSITVKLFQLPITNYKIHIEIHHTMARRTITLMDAIIDCCDFMKNRKRFQAFDRLFSVLDHYTNFNHTCPLNVSSEKI